MTKPDVKPGTQRQLFDRMDGKAQEARSNAFRAGTQGPGKQMIYGAGKPENVPKPKRKKGAK